jgi:thiol:disulfide interchange protein DsbD
LFLLLAVFSEQVLRFLPKTGPWMSAAKIALAGLLFALAYSLLNNSFPSLGRLLPRLDWWPAAFLVGFSFILIGILLCRIRRNAYMSFGISLAFALFLLATPAFSRFSSPPSASASMANTAAGLEGSIAWNSNYSHAMKQAAEERKALLIDFSADWCGTCKEFEHGALRNTEVRKQLEKFVLLRVDMTSPSDEALDIASRFSVIGLPAVRFVNSDGEEMKELRVNEALPPDSFLTQLRIALESIQSNSAFDIIEKADSRSVFQWFS